MGHPERTAADTGKTDERRVEHKKEEREGLAQIPSGWEGGERDEDMAGQEAQDTDV